MILLLALLLVGCAEQPTYQVVVNAELKPYVALYEREALILGKKVNTSHISVIFADLAGDVVGNCSFAGPVTIRIDSEFWTIATEAQKEVLVFHELAHCTIGRSHNHEWLFDGTTHIRYSIMAPELLTDYEWLSYRNNYLRELFLLPNPWSS